MFWKILKKFSNFLFWFKRIMKGKLTWCKIKLLIFYKCWNVILYLLYSFNFFFFFKKKKRNKEESIQKMKLLTWNKLQVKKLPGKGDFLSLCLFLQSSIDFGDISINNFFSLEFCFFVFWKKVSIHTKSTYFFNVRVRIFP